MTLGDITATYASERNVCVQADDGKAPPASGKMALTLFDSLPSPARPCVKTAPCAQTMPPREASEPACASYRERLRAGGRGALQRGARAGVMPKNMNQEWSAGFLAQQSVAQHGQHTWSEAGQMQSRECWQFPANQPQAQQQQLFMQHAPQLQQQMVPQPMQMMQMTQMQAMSQGQEFTPTASGANTPADFDRCMAIVMGQSGQLAGNKDLMAAQLQAAADCQCYED